MIPRTFKIPNDGSALRRLRASFNDFSMFRLALICDRTQPSRNSRLIAPRRNQIRSSRAVNLSATETLFFSELERREPRTLTCAFAVLVAICIRCKVNSNRGSLDSLSIRRGATIDNIDPRFRRCAFAPYLEIAGGLYIRLRDAIRYKKR